MYLLDLWRGQTASDLWIEAWCDLVRKWRPAFWAEEQGQIISGVGPAIVISAPDQPPALVGLTLDIGLSVSSAPGLIVSPN
jgi:hypothetical protein